MFAQPLSINSLHAHKVQYQRDDRHRREQLRGEAQSRREANLPKLVTLTFPTGPRRALPAYNTATTLEMHWELRRCLGMSVVGDVLTYIDICA